MHFGIKMAAPMKKFLTRIVSQSGDSPLGTVIFLHGSGDSGLGVQEWVNSALGVKQLTFPHLRLLYPTAPARPYTPMMGQYSNVWYDRQQISPLAPDDASVDVMAADLSELIQSEVQLGIPINRILIGGFSMGGGMALQLGYRYLREVAGVFAMSSFLGKQSLVYQALQSDARPVPPLFQSHGEEDSLVMYPWGQDTFKRLTELGVKGQFHSVPGVYHDLDKQTLLKLCDWINVQVPQS
ncbi:lysophospholipase-like protein 1 isoform X2 [Mercenaria mercenaria]|uniref:lysophospholipase-like protein 1 isoform X2 n=1 Tax=Mercenaria mercenaria TaxID=6596 RepID=UPI00234ED814|nr:lysophospholipase-like protein 1 isoform X2 [Mercenaria mercenaria]